MRISYSNEVVFTYLNCFALKSSVREMCERELEIIVPFKGAAILLQCSVHDISKYQTEERFCSLLRRSDFQVGVVFNRSLSWLVPDPRGLPRRGRGSREPRSPARAARTPARSGSSACSAGSAGLRGRDWARGVRALALSFGRSLQTDDDTALPTGGSHTVQGCRDTWRRA